MSKPITFKTTARRILCAFDDGRARRLGELAAAVGKSNPTVCRALQRLSAGGAVQRVQLTNRRSSLVFVATEQGEKLRCVYLNQKWGHRTKQEVVTPREAFHNLPSN